MSDRKKIAALLVAAGKGLRAGGGGPDNLPKQYQLLGGRPVLRRSAEAFLSHDSIDLVLVVIADGAETLYDAAIDAEDNPKLLPPVTGGDTRQASVRNGLEALKAHAPDYVLIHDAARPLVADDTIDSVIGQLATHKGAIAALPVNDTLKKSLEGTDIISESPSRENLWRAQTPQGFDYTTILALHEKYAGKALTDDASLMEEAGLKVALVPDRPENLKITRQEDFAMARKLMGLAGPEFRTGHGFDVHAFEAGEQVTLCGVEIAHSHKLKGHSDADVGMHALTDALYGALGAGDIGDHFPPSDEQWRGAASHIFLSHAASLVADRGGMITHCDVTLICEKPKIGPHREAMRMTLADILKIDPQRVSVKATTSERLGFTGREEGISAMATATICLPAPDHEGV